MKALVSFSLAALNFGSFADQWQTSHPFKAGISLAFGLLMLAIAKKEMEE